MFMLAATTASIVLFRMLGSENFSSGARLKASEAYQASESGVDAVHSWLANRGVEAGELVTQYVETAPKPIKIDLGGMKGDKQQNFEAYLIGADVTGGNNQPVRLKVLVQGKARDNSEVTQTAILKVSGLYKTTITPLKDFEDEPPEEPEPVQVDKCEPQPNPEPPTCTADPPPPPSVAKCALPDLWGNMATVGRIDARTMIITQTADECNGGGQALNSIKIGSKDTAGYLILDGNFYANNGINIYGDLYANGVFDMCASGSDWIKKATEYKNGPLKGGNIYVNEFHPRVSMSTLLIEGSAYFADSVNPNVLPKKVCNPAGGSTQLGCQGQLGGTVNIKGNTTIRGPYFAFTGEGGGGNLDFKMEGNLVMDGKNGTNGKRDTIPHINLNYESADNISTSKFEVKGNAYIKQFTTNQSQNKNNDNKPGLWPTFGSKLCLGPNVSWTGTAPNYKDNSNPNFNFKSTNAAPSKCDPDASWGADPLKNLEEELVLKGSMKQSCERPPVKFDMDIYNNVKTTTAKWAHRDGQPGGCAPGSGQMNLSKEWSPLLTELNTCWKSKKSDEIYKKDPSDKNEWFVIYVKNNYNFQRVDGNLGDGKFIIIFDFEKGKPAFDPNNPYNIGYLYLPPTGKNSIVMLYFPNGFNGRIELAGQETGKIPQTSEYNYFIFSDGDIREFNTTAERFLHGNVFMNKCAKINLPSSATNPYFYSKGNDVFVDQLMESSILSATEHCNNSSGGGNTPTPTYTLKCTPPPATGFVGDAIQQPRVTCEGSNNTSKLCGFDWVDAPSWNCLKDEKIYNVRVKANAKSGNCQKSPEVSCGTLTVSKPENTTVTCNGLPKNRNVGENISEPTVKCGTNKLTGGFNFTGDVPNWNKLEEGTYNVGVKVTSGTCNNVSAQCGTLTVKDPSKTISLNDESWIPISSRLSVKVESKEISKQKVPTGIIKDLEKSILVMPRLVRISELPSDVNKRQYIRNRYSYMYMNGATKNDTVSANQLKCTDPSNGIDLFGDSPQKGIIYSCSFTGTTGTLKAKHSRFYVNLGGASVGGGDGGNDVGEAECVLTTKKYTHGQNVQAAIKCENGGAATNVVFEAMFGPPLARDLSGNYYYPGPEDNNNAIISAYGKCGSKDVEGICYAIVNGERNYTLEIARPTCYMNPGPHESKCPQADPYNCSGSNCCVSNPPVAAPTHDCGTASTDPTPYPKFNYSPENDIGLTGNIDNIKWNEDPPKPHNFNTIGLNRVTRMYEVSCGGHVLNYGTKNGKDGINCGPFDVIVEGTSGNYKPDLATCQANVSCSINACQKKSVGIPPPTFACKTGSSSYVRFRYSDISKPGQLSTTIPDKWNNGELQSFQSDGKREVFIQEIRCDDKLLKCSSGAVTDQGLPCGFVDIKNDCASVSATCKLAKSSVTQGENIGIPTITCSNGAEPSFPNFSTSGSHLPNGATTNWTSGSGYAYYTDAHEPGDYTISVSSVNCGETSLINIPCGTINVKRPTCISPSGTYTIGQSVPFPTYGCGNASASDPKFNYTGNDDGDVSKSSPTGWNRTPPESHPFTAVVANRNVYMYQINCDGHPLTLGQSGGKDGVHCTGSFNIVSSSSAASSSSVRSSSSVASSSSGGGGGGCTDYEWPGSGLPTLSTCLKVTSLPCASGQQARTQCGSSTCSVTVGSDTWNGNAWETKLWPLSNILGQNVTFTGTFNGIGCQ